MASGSDRQPIKLTKEVGPPEQRHNGVAVMLVASTAMFFAVAGSAFILRARMARECHSARRAVPAMIREASTRTPAQVAPVAAPTTSGAATAGDAECAPTFSQSDDGATVVIYRACASPAFPIRSAPPASE